MLETSQEGIDFSPDSPLYEEVVRCREAGWLVADKVFFQGEEKPYYCGTRIADEGLKAMRSHEKAWNEKMERR